MKTYLLLILVIPFFGWSQVQIGQDIDGEAQGDNSGAFSGVSLSSDGSIVAIGAWRNNGNNGNLTGSGHVRVYENMNGIWTQIGQDIDGEASGDLSGESVSLSSDGSIVAIGARFNDGNGVSSGHVRVYDLSTVLSLDSFKKDYFNYYPNPVKEVLNINLNSGLELIQINIYNSLGQYLFSTKTATLNLADIKSGLYILELETSAGTSAKKFIVE